MLLLLVTACVPPHLVSKLLTGRSRWPRRFLAGAARICGARVSVRGEPVQPHSLLVANHISWLDILVLGSATGCAFVSKDNLGHGVIHWLADQNGTLYVRREHRKGARTQALAVGAALERDRPIAVFPEGTVGPGDHLLPFRSTLLEAVNFARKDIHVRPVAIDYGAATRDISWHGETGRENMLRVLGRKGRFAVTVNLLSPVERGNDRKSLARETREAIGAALASSRAPADLYARAK